MVHGRVSRLLVHDVRFPTSLGGHGSDAMVSEVVIQLVPQQAGLRGCGKLCPRGSCQVGAAREEASCVPGVKSAGDLGPACPTPPVPRWAFLLGANL